MNEFNINLVGKEENIKKEEIFNNFDFNYLPMNNLPISYFPLNNPLLSKELKNKDIDTISNSNSNISTQSGIILNSDDKFIKISSNYNLKITEDIDVDLLLVGGGGGGHIYSSNFSNHIIIEGGTLINSNSIKFTSNGTFKTLLNITCDVLIVGGGGAGGKNAENEAGGGGGGGGVGIGKINFIANKIYKIKIGNGGKRSAEYYKPGGNGEDTIIMVDNSKIEIAYGGGGGNGALHSNGNDGGSGGGGSGYQRSSNGGNGLKGLSKSGEVTYYGNKGGNGLWSGDGNFIDRRKGGGGGGAGGVGGVGGGGMGGGDGDGHGGIGIRNDYSGSNIEYGKGGSGGIPLSDADQNSGSVNTGNGGDGSSRGMSGNGGSGIVIIRFSLLSQISGGGGGEVIYLKDYKLKKGFYNITIGLKGETDNKGKNSLIIKNNIILFEARGGNKPDINLKLGGASYKNNLGKGTDTILNDNSGLGELIKIEDKIKYYGNGGSYLFKLNYENTNKYAEEGRGGNGEPNSSGNGVFILKYKNNDIDYIKKIENRSISNINTINDSKNSLNISIEPTYDNPDYKLLVYRTTGILKLNNDILCDILIVGGGGSGANNCVGWEGGGGGGGGGVGMGTIILKSGIYDIIIGNGGNAITTNGNGLKGDDTSINGSGISEIAYGGGYGSLEIGGSGGSGGGSAGSGELIIKQVVLVEVVLELLDIQQIKFLIIMDVMVEMVYYQE